MRRWNGWGDEATNYPLPDSAAAYLADLVGEGPRLEDASLEQALASVGTSRLPAHPGISTDEKDRLLHARGQSLPDWVALRSGRVGVFPDGVACPASDADVRILLDYARQAGAKVIPYGGGTSVVGHINPLPGDAPVLTMDLSRMNRLLAFDEASRLATFEAGAAGPEIEKQLNARGFTLGHFPQSFELSTLGGWIVTRSSGQQSLHYGRIENLFAGGRVETPAGALDLPPHPASAAGPDLRQAVLGSEGRLGVVTRATVRVRPVPAYEKFTGHFFHEWEAGAQTVRAIVQAGLPVSMLRMSNAMETSTTLALAGKEELVRLADRGLRLLRYGDGRSLLVMGVTDETGSRSLVRDIEGAAGRIIRAHGGLPTGTFIGKMWRKSRFYSPYLRNTLWERGYALDTLETAVPWSQVSAIAEETQKVIRTGLANIGERVLVFAHLSHVYNDGASIYITYLFRRANDPEETLRRWHLLKDTASRVIVAHGGTISHQHGVGFDHLRYLPAEKGVLGMDMLKSVCRQLDPDGMMNPGKLLEK
jgi:alkyldihydroxyacetonephosphate synthase